MRLLTVAALPLVALRHQPVSGAQRSGPDAQAAAARPPARGGRRGALLTPVSTRDVVLCTSRASHWFRSSHQRAGSRAAAVASGGSAPLQPGQTDKGARCRSRAPTLRPPAQVTPLRAKSAQQLCIYQAGRPHGCTLQAVHRRTRKLCVTVTSVCVQHARARRVRACTCINT